MRPSFLPFVLLHRTPARLPRKAARSDVRRIRSRAMRVNSAKWPIARERDGIALIRNVIGSVSAAPTCHH